LSCDTVVTNERYVILVMDTAELRTCGQYKMVWLYIVVIPIAFIIQCLYFERDYCGR